MWVRHVWCSRQRDFLGMESVASRGTLSWSVSMEMEADGLAEVVKSSQEVGVVDRKISLLGAGVEPIEWHCRNAMKVWQSRNQAIKQSRIRQNK